MCLLLLRGAQTSAELRARTERMYAFDDNAAVMSVLERLAGREEPLTQLMQRQPGAREARWVQLLTGAPSDAQMSGAVSDVAVVETHVSEARHGAPDALAQRVAELEEVVRGLEERLGMLERALGGETPGGES